jgi:molecular chaperone GrpE
MSENVQNKQSEQPQENMAPAAAETATGDTAASATGMPANEGSPADAEWQEQVAKLSARNAELVDQFLRAQAEMQNVRRRSEEEVSKARKFAVEGMAESLLPVCDSLEAGLAHQDATVEQIRAGAEATLRQLKAALERNKVIEINPAAGAKFDPHQHQAISVVPAEQEANTVVTVLQKGYSIADRVLRPALVTVAASK